jgi:hypothetical protein
VVEKNSKNFNLVSPSKYSVLIGERNQLIHTEGSQVSLENRISSLRRNFDASCLMYCGEAKCAVCSSSVEIRRMARVEVDDIMILVCLSCSIKKVARL